MKRSLKRMFSLLVAVGILVAAAVPLSFGSVHDTDKKEVSSGGSESGRSVCGLLNCGYVYQTGTMLGYEVYMADFIDAWQDQLPAPADTIHNLVWGIFGNVDEPSGCGGSISECALTEYVGGCDENATFHVYYYDAAWNQITDYGFTSNEIGYATPC